MSSLYKLNKDELIYIITKIEDEHKKEINLLEEKHNIKNMNDKDLQKLFRGIISERSKRNDMIRGIKGPTGPTGPAPPQ